MSNRNPNIYVTHILALVIGWVLGLATLALVWGVPT